MRDGSLGLTATSACPAAPLAVWPPFTMGLAGPALEQKRQGLEWLLAASSCWLLFLPRRSCGTREHHCFLSTCLGFQRQSICSEASPTDRGRTDGRTERVLARPGTFRPALSLPCRSALRGNWLLGFGGSCQAGRISCLYGKSPSLWGLLGAHVRAPDLSGKEEKGERARPASHPLPSPGASPWHLPGGEQPTEASAGSLEQAEGNRSLFGVCSSLPCRGTLWGKRLHQAALLEDL